MNFNNTLWYGSRLGGEDKGSEIDVQMMGVMTKAAAQGRAPQDNFKAVHCIVGRLDLQESAILDAGQCKTGLYQNNNCILNKLFNSIIIERID